MKKNPLFSIITINLNTATGLTKTLESIRHQTFNNFEVIVIDGGSNDGSIEVINNYLDTITFWKSEPDKGRYDGMNKGVDKAKGKYLLFLNPGDTLYERETLKKVSEFTLDGPLYFGDLMVNRGEGIDLERVSFKDLKIDISLLKDFALPHQATFFHKSLFKKYGKYDEKYAICGDQDYFMRLVKNGVKFEHIPVQIAVYGMDGISSSLSSKSLSQKEKALALDTNFGYPVVHFLTIVLYGEPFIRYHIEIFKKLPFKWHWHIVEGASDLKHDTSWSLINGATVPQEFHNKGRSNDGTGEYIDRLKKEFPDNITIYRKPLGEIWDGKIEMVRAPLKNIQEESLLWQIDADEYWTVDQIVRTRELFMLKPEKTAAFFMSYVFVGDNLVLNSFNTYGNTLEHEWLRVWRFKPGDDWIAHEPPALGRKDPNGFMIDIAKINPFEQVETESHNLIFQHFSYVLEKQLRFKESFYGYKGAVEKWKQLNRHKKFPVLVKKYFDWVKDDVQVVTTDYLGIEPLLVRTKKGKLKSITNAKTQLPRMDSFRYLLSEHVVQQKRELLNGNYPNHVITKSDIELRAIQSSKGWRAILLFRRIVNRILPVGSLRRRAAIFILKSPSYVLKAFRFAKRVISRFVLLLRAFRDRFSIMRKLKDIILRRKTAPVIIPPKPPYIYKPYHFINWLKFANAGMLNEGNIFAFEYVIANLPSNKPIIEIGSFCGLSTNLINFYLSKSNKKNKLFTCDKWIFEGAESQENTLGGSNLKNSEYRDFVKQSYMRNTSFFSKNNLPYTIESFSDEFFTFWDDSRKVTDVFDREVSLGGQISFAYIDGNHSYESAKKDFINCDKYLELGGFILFDDSGDESGWGVCKVIKEIKEDSRYEVVLQNPNYLVRKIKE